LGLPAFTFGALCEETRLGVLCIRLSLFLFLHLPDKFVILVFRRFVSKSMELHFAELVSARTEGLAFGIVRLLWICLPLRWGE
jgi:hypothetical protein